MVISIKWLRKRQRMILHEIRNVQVSLLQIFFWNYDEIKELSQQSC